MRERDRPSDHEATWARELDRPQSPQVERQLRAAEGRLRDHGANLDQLRTSWANFDSANPMEGESIHRDYLRAAHIAYARVVDGLMRDECGEGLRERVAHDDGRDVDVDTSELRQSPPVQDPALPSNVRVVPARLSDGEREVVHALADERIMRLGPGAVRPSTTRPENWYLARARALECSSARAFSSVEREVARLQDLPQLSTTDATASAVDRTASEFESDRALGIDNEKLRTRLYALALVHELRTREPAERVVLPTDITQPRRQQLREFPQDHATQPGRKNVRAPGAANDRTVDVDNRDIVAEHDVSREGREADDDVSFNTRLSSRYRDRASENARDLARISGDAERELFWLRSEAASDPDAARQVAAIDEAVIGLRSASTPATPVDLASKVQELREREQADLDVTDGRLRIERLAYGVLASEAYQRHHNLVRSAERDRLDEIRALPDDERNALKREVTRLLQEPAYNDRPAMGRELLRAEDDGAARRFVVAHAAVPLAELKRAARWCDRAFHDRVDERVHEHLRAPDGDAALQQALAAARVRTALAGSALELSQARAEAIEVAEVLRRLPMARSRDLDTPPSAYRTRSP